MNRFFVLYLLLVGASALHAQGPWIADHGWSPSVTVPDTVRTMTEPTVLLRRTMVVDVVEEGDALVEHYLMHNTIFLRDMASIEVENKVYINLNDVIEVTAVKARTITPDGTILELAPEAFKRASNEEERGRYIYFACEGLVPGSIIDYFYILKKKPDLRGDLEQLQMGVPILKEDFHLLHPERLVYKTKSYMGAPEAQMDTTVANVAHHRFELTNVPALETEKSANMGAAPMRVVYFLDRVPDRDITGYSGYVGATDLYFNAICAPVDGKTGKSLDDLIKQLKISAAKSDEAKVRTLEDRLKTGYAIIEASNEDLDHLDAILKNKACSKFGMVKLTCALLTKLGIDYQLVLTSDRTSLPFDPDLESYLFLQDMILYLPSLDKYMAPANAGLRLGYAPSGNMANDGLFIRRFNIGGTFTGVGSVKHIRPLPDSATIHDHIITADLSKDPTECNLTFSNLISGYYATLQCYYSYLDDAKKKELTEEMVSYLLENGTVEELTVENGESRLFGVEPLIIKGHVATRKFNGNAGDKVLFKIGELIGPQAEMYADKPRKLPVDAGFNRRFNRSIDVVLPAGWSVQNLNDLVMDKYLEMDGQRVASFKSSYVLEGQTVKVRIEEHYRRIKLPLDQFENYRQVINAAADFNKVALVLVKD